ncbi:helitron_like_N domain-containing protein [Trichonephila clavipes]|nr:helitron_like_N domain-containing protein [Trichonephila clavipes]
MRARAYCDHPSIRDHLALRCMSRCPDLIESDTKLRSKEYIHLQDAVVNEGNTTNIGKMIILPSSYIGSPRHMQEYAQDAMAYVRHYGRPDLFITFTCNHVHVWDEIQQLLLPGQLHVDRHDITARVFRRKLKSLMDFIVKYEVFGFVCCWMYSVEWQKRGLSHAHILIWLYNTITSDKIDDVICVEIPRADVDKDLHAVIIKNVIHGPCGALNSNSPCMVDGKCSKKYSRAFTANTITRDNGYPRYRRRSTEDCGNSAAVRMQNGLFYYKEKCHASITTFSHNSVITNSIVRKSSLQFCLSKQYA